jgi:hypothetical protein
VKPKNSRNSGGSWTHAPPSRDQQRGRSEMASSHLHFSRRRRQRRYLQNTQNATSKSVLVLFSDRLPFLSPFQIWFVRVLWICFTADRSPSVILFFSSAPCARAARRNRRESGVAARGGELAAGSGGES